MKKWAGKELERDIEKYLVDRVNSLGGLCLKLRFFVGGGWPDRVIFLCGCLHLVELKKKGGRLSGPQKLWFSRLEKAGFPVSVLWSKEDVDKFMLSVSF